MNLPAGFDAIVRRCRSVCVLTGAGVSAESGVATFRGADGLWNKFRPEELANVEAFLANPKMVWEWYAYRRQLLSDVKPNEAHRALARLEALVPDMLVATQNVDGLHQLAGSTKVVEIHGNIRKNHCQTCKKPVEIVLTEHDGPPLCPSCGGMVRPSVVWFGEMLPREAFGSAERAARHCDLFLSIGTSGIVHPAASLPFTAKNSGAYLLEIDPEPTLLSSYADGVVRAPATVGVSAVVGAFEHQRNPS